MPKQSLEAPEQVGSTQQENRAVERYLQYITYGKLPEPPNHTVAIERLDARIAEEPRLYMKANLIAQRHALANPVIDPQAITDDFVKYAGAFSIRNHISYAVWREMGVPVQVLQQAGLVAKGGTRMAPDDPNRIKPFHTRRVWTDDEKAEYIAFYQANGAEATVEKYGGRLGTVQGRYYEFRAQAAKAAGEPPRKPGRPPTKRAS